MLGLSIGMLVWRMVEGATPGRVVGTLLLVVTWSCLLTVNLTARRRHRS
jgi:hypothetical protein